MSTPLRVLILEDRSADAGLMVQQLRRSGFHVHAQRVNTEQDYLAYVSPTLDLILASAEMPGLDALRALRLLQGSGIDIPFIIVANAIGEEWAVEALKGGAADYLLKSRLARLGPAVTRAVQEKHLRDEKRRTEAALKGSEERFRSLVEHGTAAIALLGQDGTILYASQSAERVLGCPVGDLVGRNALTFAHSEDRAPIKQLFLDCLSQPQTPVRGGYRFLQHNGSWRDLEATWVNRLEDDAVKAVVATYHDVTHHKRAEEALRQSERRYRELFREDPTGIFVCTPAGSLVACNPTFARIFGYTCVEEALKGGVASLFLSQGALHETLRQLGAQTRLERHELELRRRDGQKIYVTAILTGSVDERDELVEIKGYLFDETDRRHLEAQLLQAQKMEAVGQLAGGIAHDFNNSLTVIIGVSSLLLDRVRDRPDLAADIQEIQKAGERAGRLTRQLLAFSRKQMLVPQVLDLNTVVADLDRMLRRVIGEDIVLTAILASSLGHVKADPSQVEQALLNLVVNARDAMPSGGTLTIETANALFDEAFVRRHVGSQPGRYVSIAVRDTGCGMAPDVLAHVFEPFFTTKGPGKGTGLGLSMVYGIVKQSGGYITVESTPSHGATFTVYLPQVDEWDASVRVARTLPDTLVGTETILLAEDEAGVRDLMRTILEQYGYAVLEARDGVEAMAIAERHPGPIQLLLSDIIMPGLSGPDLAQRLVPLRRGIKVLFVTGHTSGTATSLGSISPNIRLLQKPFTPKDLGRKVRECLDGAEDELVG